MKKKLKLLLLFISCILPFNVDAASGSTDLKCSKTSVVPGETITCTVQGNVSDGAVSALSSKITTSGNLTISEVIVDPIWEGSDEVNLDLYTDEDKTGTFAIATFIVQVSNGITGGATGTITVGSTKFYDADYSEIAIDDKSQSIKVLSTVNTLASITLSQGTLVPTFNSNTTSYSVALNADKVTISANATDSSSIISGNTGMLSLNYGVNTFKINVKSESSSTRTYTITITRPDDRSTDNTLSSLKVNNNEIVLVDEKFDYTYEVDENVKEVTVSAELNDSKASFVTGYGPRTVTMNDGRAEIQLKVKAENETIKTYTIVVTNKQANIVTNNDKTTTSTTTNGTLTNPKTGSIAIYVVIAILVISIPVGIYSYKLCKKKKAKNNGEQK